MPRQVLWGGTRLLGEGPSLRNVARLDANCLPMVHAMQMRGLQVDLDHFANMDRVLTDDMERVTSEVSSIAGHYVNPGSGDQVSALLFKEMGLKQARPTLTKGGNRESVEHEVLVAIQHEHPVVAKILAYKEYDKLRGTYARPLLRLARKVDNRWRVFPNLKTTRVPSGRFSCDEPNLLAMPNRTPRGRELLKGFITDPGWVLLSVDESQIEPRTVAHRSEDPALMAVYHNQQDLYSDFATSAFMLPDKRFKDEDGWHYPGIDKKLHRFPSKTCSLASIYRVTGIGLLQQMPVICKHCHVEAAVHQEKDCPLGFAAQWNEDNCTDIINAFYLKYARISGMQRMDDARARKYAFIWDDWGRLMHTTAVRSVHPWVVSAALREAGNMPIQCIPAETRILTDKGFAQIGSFRSGSVWTGEKWAQATQIKKGVGELIRVTLQDGADFICDTSHKVLCQRTPWPQWTLATDLQVNDVLPSTLVAAPHGDRVETTDFWYWVGRYYGDGHIQKRHYSEGGSGLSMAFGTKEIADAERLREFAVTRGHSVPRLNTQYKRGGGSAIQVTSHTLWREFVDWGVTPNDYSWSKRITDVVFTLSLSRRLSFLKGYYDADGNGEPRYDKAKYTWSQQNITSVCKGLLQDTQLIYRSVGIPSRIMGPYHNKDGHRDFFRLVLDSELKTRKVKQVERLNLSAPVFTLSVDDEKHAYDSEGLISKNSFACGTLKLVMARAQAELTQSGYYKSVWYPLLPIHDEVLSETRADVAEEIGEYIAECFRTCVQLRVPLDAEWAQAEQWGAIVK